MEEWRKVAHNDNYSVSNLGRVRNDRRGNILKPHKQKTGYMTVVLRVGGRAKTFKVHRLVAFAFLDLSPDAPRNIVVMHLDDDKTNNVLSNLQVGRQYENMSYRVKEDGGVFLTGNGYWKTTFYLDDKYLQKYSKDKEEVVAWRKEMREKHR